MPARVPTFRPRSFGLSAIKRPSDRAYRRTAQRHADHLFYCSLAWLRLRALVLSEEPLCWWCEQRDETTAATTVHHVVERHVRPDLELDRENLHSSCASCHSRWHASKKGKRTG
jgi:5-methylcytosine-specific restriction endonuclease McrA